MNFSETSVYKFLKSLISADEKVSSKRIVALLAVLTVEIIAFVNLFTGKTVEEFIFDGVIMLALGSLGITGVETIFKKDSSNNNSENI